jgi:hypothetical protein
VKLGSSVAFSIYRTMKTIIAVIIISIVTAIVANAQPVNIAAAVQNSAAAASQQNSGYEGPSDIQGFVAWKSPPSMDAKARYDAFLRSKGIDPNMIGAATVANGRMSVPAIEEQCAARHSKYAALNRALSGAPNSPRRPAWWYISARPNKDLYTSQ